MSRTASHDKDAVAVAPAEHAKGDFQNFQDLLHFATTTDIVLIVVGSICKALYGVLGVAILIIFADFFDATGRDFDEEAMSVEEDGMEDYLTSLRRAAGLES